MAQMNASLKIDTLREAIKGSVAAFRCRTRLQPAGGNGDKVFPPTYAGGVYAVEQRRIRNGKGEEEIVPCVLLDSVQSQANRLEEALLDAYECQQMSFPLLVVDFGVKEDGAEQDDPDIRRIGKISALETPHRIADAIVRDSVTVEGAAFRESPQGKAFEESDIRHATALFELCPTALIFGTWDSTGSRGGLGNKFARALVSEIVGVNAQTGVRTSSRIDPLGIEKCELYVAKKGGWTVHKEEAAEKKKGEPEKFATKSGKGNPSAINHGNVTPDIAKGADNEPIGGGVTISYALQTTVLSLPQLRRLRFPDKQGNRDPDRDLAARTVLAAMALAATALAREGGCDLRSRCLLVPADTENHIELVTNATDCQQFALSSESALQVFREAVQAAKDVGFKWNEAPFALRPTNRLVDLVKEGRKAAVKEGGE